MKKSLAFLPLLAIMAVSACETVQGAGRDLETAGQTIERESVKTQYGIQ